MSKDFSGQLQVKRRFNMYPIVQQAAFHFMKLATETEYGSFHTSMACIVFTAFQYEAALNEIGMAKNVPGWDEGDLRKTLNKENAVYSLCGLVLDRSTDEYQKIRSAFKVRDLLAHPKPTIIENSVRKFSGNFDEFQDRADEVGQAHWEQCANPHFAKATFDVVSKVASELFRAAGIDEGSFSLSEMSVSLEPRVMPKSQTPRPQ